MFLGIDIATIDVNMLYLGLIISLWIAVTAAYVPGTGLLEGVAVLGIGASLYLMAQFPVSWVALLVLVIGVGGFIVVPFIDLRYAPFALVGLILQAGASFFLFRDGTLVSPFVIVLTLVVQFAYYQFVLMPLLRLKDSEPEADKDMMLVGSEGRVVKDIDPVGTVLVNSEHWSATSERPIKAGEHIVVLDRRGLQLTVESIKRKRRAAEEAQPHSTTQ